MMSRCKYVQCQRRELSVWSKAHQHLAFVQAPPLDAEPLLARLLGHVTLFQFYPMQGCDASPLASLTKT